MVQVFWLTLQKVCMMLLFAAVGFALRRGKLLPEKSGRVLSVLCASVFLPAYTFRQLHASMTPDTLREDGFLALAGLLWFLGLVPVAYLLRRLLGKSPEEKATLTYLFIFSNYGYFGYPVVEGVFGKDVLGKFFLFLLPFSIAINSFGYYLFMEHKGGPGKVALELVKTPLIWGLLLGMATGLLRLPLPGPVSDVVDGAAACMSPCSMLLAGFLLGGYPLKYLFRGRKGYLIVFLRMLALPAAGLGICLLLRLKGYYLLFPAVMLCMPVALNTVIFPESRGHDASENARMVCQSTLLTLVTLPPAFALISYLAGELV